MTKELVKVWENGEAINLTEGSGIVRAISIYRHECDIYVAGYEIIDSIFRIKVWKNGFTINSTEDSIYA